MNRNRFGFAALAIVAGSTLAFAQQSTGALKGRVTIGNSGGPKSGVTVTILNRNTGLTRTQVTEANGNFSFVALPVGAYDITYTAQGQTYKQTRNAALGQESDASFRFPSEGTATVEVVASSSVTATIDTNSAQVGTTIGSDIIKDLPLGSRDINQAAILAPGVQIVSGAQVDPTKKSSSYITTGDGMGRGTSFAVDGADNNSTDVGGYVLAVPIDAIAEFQVVTNQYKAEFGRSTAGFFNIVTKSGSNEFSGIISAQYTNQSLRAKRTDEGTKSDDNLGIYSATVMGPIVKDKLFYMISAERQHGASKAFDFQPNAIALYPALAGVRQEVTKKNIYARLDWNMTADLNSAWTYGYYQDETPNQPFPRTQAFGGNVPPEALGTGANKTWAAGGKITWNLNSHSVFESNARYFDYKNGIHPFGPGPGNGSPMALLEVDTDHSPRTDPQNFGWGGLDPNAIQNTGIKRFQWKNELIYLTADHTMKGGIEFQRTTYADQQLFFNETGLYRTFIAGYNYANGWGSSVNADENVMEVRFIANGALKGISFKQYGFYLQDDWVPNAKWAFYLGARLDWDTQLDYLKDRYAGLYQKIHENSPSFAAINGSAPEGKKYFQPRIQALYKPNGDDSMVWKFGAGHFVANVIDNVTGFSRGLSLPVNGLPLRSRNLAAYNFQGVNASGLSSVVSSFRAGSTIANVNGHPVVLPADLTPYNYTNNVNGLRDYFRNTVNGWLTAADADTDGKALLASDFQYPTTDAFNVGFSFKVNERSAFDITAVYSKSKHLTVNLGSADGSGPLVEEYDSNGDPIGDSIFYSNQTASSLQLQLKYAYASPTTSFITTLVFKDQKSSEGGAAGAFDASGATGGLYGEGARFAFQANPERRSPGTERLQGSIQYAHRFSIGTSLSILGLWHSGKAYDVIQNYNDEYGPDNGSNPNPNAGVVDVYHPISYLGSKEGHWAMDISLKVSHKFQITKKLAVEPFLSVQNLLNNYDYGSNFDGIKYNNDGGFNEGDGSATSGFGHRGQSFSASQPRTATVGARITF